MCRTRALSDVQLVQLLCMLRWLEKICRQPHYRIESAATGATARLSSRAKTKLANQT